MKKEKGCVKNNEMKFSFEIITPEKIAYKDDIEEVIVPTLQGQIAILPNHTALLTQVSSGEITVKKDNKEYYLVVTGGFLEVAKNNVTLLADYAVRSEDIEVSKALEAQKRAEKLMKESGEKISKKDFAYAEAQLRRSILELKVASRRRKVSLPLGSNI